MWYKFLALALLVAAIYGEKVVNSTPKIYKLGTATATVDSSKVFYLWCDYFTKVGFKFPRVITAQAVHETAYFSSTIYKQNKNLFGMKENCRGFCDGQNLGHAFYKRPSDSVRDYLAYQRRMLYLAKKQGRPVVTEEDYFDLLEDLPHLRGHRYAEDLQYIPKLKMHIKRLEEL